MTRRLIDPGHRGHSVLGLAAACVLASGLASGPAAAQSPGTGAVVGVTVHGPTNGTGFAESLRLRETGLDEDTTFRADYPSARGPAYEVSVRVPLGGRVGAGAAVTYATHTAGATFAVSVPNPLFVGLPRTAAGGIDTARRRETALHLQLVYALLAGGRVDLTLSAGPSIFVVSQQIIESVEIDEVDLDGLLERIAVTDVERARSAENTVGFNAGVDATWWAGRHVGLGGTARYTRGSVALRPGSSVAADRRIRFTAGNLYLGGGLRFRF